MPAAVPVLTAGAKKRQGGTIKHSCGGRWVRGSWGGDHPDEETIVHPETSLAGASRPQWPTVCAPSSGVGPYLGSV